MTVHGQTDQLRLRAPARQREALDRFAGADGRRGAGGVRATCSGCGTSRPSSPSWSPAAASARRRPNCCASGLAEVERVQPQPGEDVALRAEASRLAHAEELRFAAEQAHLALRGDPDGAGRPPRPTSAALIAQARRALEQVAGHDPALDGARGPARRDRLPGWPTSPPSSRRTPAGSRRTRPGWPPSRTAGPRSAALDPRARR